MCGLILSFHEDVEVRDQAVDLGIKKIEHRGESTTTRDFIGLFKIAHRRLAITDTRDKTGHPYIMDTRAGATYYWTVGEYYETGPYASDVLNMGQHIENNGVLSLEGMLSVVKYTPSMPNTLFIFIDRLGKKPLYYNQNTKTICSEIKGLCLSKDLTPNKKFLNHSVTDPFITPYEEIVRLTPGFHVIDLKKHELKTKVSLPPITYRNINFPELVQKRVPKEVPYANLLSGGLDSSLIDKCIDSDLTLFYKDGTDDMGERLARAQNPNMKLISNEDQDRDWVDLAYINESPIDLGSLLPQYDLFKAIKDYNKDIKVVITGDGADELFSGYRRCQKIDTYDYDMLELQSWHIPRLDKVGMWFGLEVRCPFMDDILQAFSASQTYYDRVGKKHVKKWAKEAGVNPMIINRPKVPLKHKDLEANQKLLKEAFLDNYQYGLIL